MSEQQQPQMISPERQIKSAQVASVFNPLHAYIASLYPVNPATGNPECTMQLNEAHKKIEEASFWAIQSVLKFGTQQPPAPAANGDEGSGAQVSDTAADDNAKQPGDDTVTPDSEAPALDVPAPVTDPVPADSVTAI